MKRIVSLSIGKPQQMIRQEKEMVSAICKEQVRQATLTKDGFTGDSVANTEFHGGVDRAVCFYPYEHYQKWEKEFGIHLPSAALGENITATGMLEENVCLGDIYQLGEAVVQVTQGRIPCQTISIRNNVDIFLKRVVETGFTGFFCRVLQEGIIRSDSDLVLLDRHPQEVSVLFANLTMFHNHSNTNAVERILNVKELADVWRKKLERFKEK